MLKKEIICGGIFQQMFGKIYCYYCYLKIIKSIYLKIIKPIYLEIIKPIYLEIIKPIYL